MPTTSPPATATPAEAAPVTMRAAVARRYGGPGVVSVEEVPVPTPGPGEVLVAVRASSLNALDWHFLTGTPYFLRLMAGLRRPKRTIPGADVAGIVTAVGADVTRWSPGDEVFGECEGGACAPYAVVAETNLVAKPEGVAFEDAGSAGVAGLTAVQGLRTHAEVRPGERVLINGAAGGVGTYAVQVAKALGAEVTAVCSGRNVGMVRAIGADEVIDYTEQDFVTGGARFDVMFDNVGNRTAAECRRVLRPHGRFVIITGPKRNRWFGPVGHIVVTGLGFWRREASFHQFTAAPVVEDLAFLGELLADGRLRPQIQRVIGLDAVAEGLAEIGTGHTRAKIVVDPARD